MVMSVGGIAASEHPLASQAGASILARGGSAVDAAIAVNAAMGVVAPMMNGVGGDLFAIVYDAASRTSCTASTPADARRPRSRSSGCAPDGITSMPQTGIHSVTVPGAVAGWSTLSARFGRLPLGDVLAPAIADRRERLPGPGDHGGASGRAGEPLLRANAEASRMYLPDGEVPRVGQIFRNPDLASTYRRLASHGRDAFYRGDIARRIVECSRAHGGVLTADDLADVSRPSGCTPLSTTYRGWTVYELPPNGQGIAALMMLNLLEHSPIGSYGHNSAEALHALIEAKKLAYADMAKSRVPIPRFMTCPSTRCCRRPMRRSRRARSIRSRAQPEVAPGDAPDQGWRHHLSERRRSRRQHGVAHSEHLRQLRIRPRSRGRGLRAAKPRRPLHAGPRAPQRARTTQAAAPHDHPWLHDERRRHRSAFGIMGGWNQSQAHAQFISNVVDHGMNIQAALEAARMTKLTFDGLRRDDGVARAGVGARSS